MNARRATLWALFGMAGLLFSSAAQAQDVPWLRDRRLDDGPGIRGDKLDFNASIGAQVGYDSNLFLRSGTAGSPRTDAYVLALTPTISALTVAPSDGSRPSFSFSGTASATYYEYLQGPTKGVPQDDVSGNSNLGAFAALSLVIAPGARFSGEIHGNLVRSIQPSNQGDPTASYNRTVPGGGASVTWAPGGGLFSWRLIGYDIAYNYFESSQFKEYDNLTHTFTSTATWRFLPRTTLFSSSSITLYDYTGGTTTQANGTAVSTMIGVNGLITNNIGFLVSGGWASTFYDTVGGNAASVQDFDSLIAQAELRFYLTTPVKRADTPGIYPSALTIGYSRNYSPSYIGNFYQRDRGYAGLAYFFNGVVFATLQGGVARLGFPDTYFANGELRAQAFSNTAVDGSLFVEYRVTPNVGINLNAVYTQMISDTILPNAPGVSMEAVPGYDMRWARFQGLIGARYIF